MSNPELNGALVAFRQAIKARPKMTVTKAARLLRVTRPLLSAVINGKAPISIPLAIKVEATFGIDARALLFEQIDDILTRLQHRRARPIAQCKDMQHGS